MYCSIYPFNTHLNLLNNQFDFNRAIKVKKKILKIVCYKSITTYIKKLQFILSIKT